MRIGLRRFGEGNNRDLYETEANSVLLTIDGHGAIAIWDVGKFDWQTVVRLQRKAVVEQKHPCGDDIFMVMRLRDLYEVLGKEPGWFANCFIGVWAVYEGSGTYRLVVTDLLFE